MEKEALLTIGRPHKTCINCNARIEVIERHPSALKPAGRSRFERLDYCPDCWEIIKNEAYESFWITRREVKERGVPKMTRRQRSLALRALFESLWERREDGEVGPHIYMLSHLLMKWGGLKWRESRTDPAGCEWIVFEDLASGDQLEVPAVEMSDEQVAAVTGEIENFLRQYTPEEEIEL